MSNLNAMHEQRRPTGFTPIENQFYNVARISRDNRRFEGQFKTGLRVFFQPMPDMNMPPFLKPDGTTGTSNPPQSNIDAIIRHLPSMPFPPMVFAYTVPRSGTDPSSDTFCALIYFALRVNETEQGDPQFTICLKNSWTNMDYTPEFIIEFDKPTSGNAFRIYQANIKMPYNARPESIITYLWDKDPEGSRGTRTVVQQQVGG